LHNDEFVVEFMADFDMVVDVETLPLGPVWPVSFAIHSESKVGKKLSTDSGPLMGKAQAFKVENVEGLRRGVCSSRSPGT
jgi:hypothetical protein